MVKQRKKPSGYRGGPSVRGKRLRGDETPLFALLGEGGLPKNGPLIFWTKNRGESEKLLFRGPTSQKLGTQKAPEEISSHCEMKGVTRKRGSPGGGSWASSKKILAGKEGEMLADPRYRGDQHRFKSNQ